MRPPICAVCYSRFSPADGGSVRFADYKPLPHGMTGHPKGLEWFCGDHIEAARALTSGTRNDAVAAIRKPPTE